MAPARVGRCWTAGRVWLAERVRVRRWGHGGSTNVPAGCIAFDRVPTQGCAGAGPGERVAIRSPWTSEHDRTGQ
jgi:hypothetical protein